MSDDSDDDEIYLPFGLKICDSIFGDLYYSINTIHARLCGHRAIGPSQPSPMSGHARESAQ